MPYANIEQRLAYFRKYYAENKEKVLTRTRKYHAEHRKEQNATKRRSYRGSNRSPWTQEAFEAALIAQCGRCAFPNCGRAFRNNQVEPAGDHDHATGRPRALLCTFHNTRLGFIEGPFVLEAKQYLREHGSERTACE